MYKPMLHKIILLILLVAVLLTCPDAQAAKRVALVIGNSAYQSSPLRNPVNDAQDVAAALKRLGFEVLLKTDVGKRAMVDAARDFGQRSRGADAALFYYAGHGMQVNGRNYLIPVGASVRSESEVEFEAVDANRILAQMEDAGAGVSIVVLDACRENPFRGFRASSRGLAVIQAVTGSFVAYSTAPGSVAADGKGRNSPFTKHLLQHIAAPGQPISQLFMAVRKGVSGDTGGKQVPWDSSSLMGDFYFAGAPSGGTPPPPPVQVAMAPRPEPPSGGRAGETWTDPVTGMEFVFVPGECFQIGSNSGDDDERPVHEVCVDGFWMGKYEVTQAQWRAVMGNNPSHFKGDRNPVEQVSWNDAQEFVRKLNGRGNGTFRLPTEAEWEFAARSGGRDETYAGGNDVDRVAWYTSNSGSQTHAVGGKAPNGLGLYDMSGNVWEWVQDWYAKDAYSKHGRNNPIYDAGGSGRVIRGGSWGNPPAGVRCVARSLGSPGYSYDYLGFRLARTAD